MLKVRFLKKVKKIQSFSKSKYFLCSQWDSNLGPLAHQSSVLPTRPWRLIENLAIFQLYISICWKNQLTLKKTTASQTHFGFTNIVSGMHISRAIAIWNKKFWFGSPCRTCYNLDLAFLSEYCIYVSSTCMYRLHKAKWTPGIFLIFDPYLTWNSKWFDGYWSPICEHYLGQN